MHKQLFLVMLLGVISYGDRMYAAAAAEQAAQAEYDEWSAYTRGTFKFWGYSNTVCCFECIQDPQGKIEGFRGHVIDALEGGQAGNTERTMLHPYEMRLEKGQKIERYEFLPEAKIAVQLLCKDEASNQDVGRVQVWDLQNDSRQWLSREGDDATFTTNCQQQEIWVFNRRYRSTHAHLYKLVFGKYDYRDYQKFFPDGSCPQESSYGRSLDGYLQVKDFGRVINTSQRRWSRGTIDYRQDHRFCASEHHLIWRGNDENNSNEMSYFGWNDRKENNHGLRERHFKLMKHHSDGRLKLKAVELSQPKAAVPAAAISEPLSPRRAGSATTAASSAAILQSSASAGQEGQEDRERLARNRLCRVAFGITWAGAAAMVVQKIRPKS